MSDLIIPLLFLSPVFLYVAVRLATAAYFRSKRQYESEKSHE